MAENRVVLDGRRISDADGVLLVFVFNFDTREVVVFLSVVVDGDASLVDEENSGTTLER